MVPPKIDFWIFLFIQEYLITISKLENALFTFLIIIRLKNKGGKRFKKNAMVLAEYFFLTVLIFFILNAKLISSTNCFNKFVLNKLLLMSRPLILVTNDDGVNSKGILALIEIAQTFGDVFVVAPDGPQSGKSHAITLEKPFGKNFLLKTDSLTKYSCTGTPVDCVKMGLNMLMDKKPDIILSGINHGSNSSINVIYSGTMAAAIEGYMHGIPSIGFSLLDHSEDADFSACKQLLAKIVAMVLQKKETLCLNVNIPKLPASQIKGYKFCRQSNSNWQEKFVPADDNSDFYWMKGSFVNHDNSPDTDEWALDNGYVSIVPVQFDFTAYKTLETLKNIEL